MDRLHVLAGHFNVVRVTEHGSPLSPRGVSTTHSKADDFEIRPIRRGHPGEKEQHQALLDYVGAGSWGQLSHIPEDCTLAAFDGERLVSSHCYWPFTMRANGGAVKTAGVTSVGTIPEYRRRGLVRTMVERALADYRARGIPCAALWPSQAAIYQRYGYTFASMRRTYRVDVVDILFSDSNLGTQIVTRAGSVDGAREDLKTLYRKFIADRTGYFHRAKATWSRGCLKIENVQLHVAISRDASGSACGYVIYTLQPNKVANVARSQLLTIRELIWLDMDAYRSLWRFLAGHDLVGEVLWDSAPSDDPALEIWMEPRMLYHRDSMGFMFRLVDVTPALKQRQYNANGVLTVVVAGDTLAPWNNGCWQLDVSPAGANVTALPGIEGANNIIYVSIKALSSLYIGFRSARELATCGMVEGSAAAVDTAHSVFATKHAPHCNERF